MKRHIFEVKKIWNTWSADFSSLAVLGMPTSNKYKSKRKQEEIKLETGWSEWQKFWRIMC